VTPYLLAAMQIAFDGRILSEAFIEQDGAMSVKEV
jgi:hypothetical protein